MKKVSKRVFVTVALCGLALFGLAQVDHWETIVYEDDIWRYELPSAPVKATVTVVITSSSLIGAGASSSEEQLVNTIANAAMLKIAFL